MRHTEGKQRWQTSPHCRWNALLLASKSWSQEGHSGMRPHKKVTWIVIQNSTLPLFISSGRNKFIEIGIDSICWLLAAPNFHQLGLFLNHTRHFIDSTECLECGAAVQIGTTTTTCKSKGWGGVKLIIIRTGAWQHPCRQTFSKVIDCNSVFNLWSYMKCHNGVAKLNVKIYSVRHYGHITLIQYINT